MFTIYHIRRKRRALIIPFALLCIGMLALQSCISTKGVLTVSSVTYQAIDTKLPQSDLRALPDSAKILTTYAIDMNGKIAVVIKNLTDSIMTIDQERSLLLNTNGMSQQFYDPNTYSTTNTTYSFSTVGVWTSYEYLLSAFGVTGPSVWPDDYYTISNSNTVGSSVSNTITIIDQKTINIAPHGTVALSKAFPIFGVGRNNAPATSIPEGITYATSPMKFSIYISYSCDGGKYYDKLVTDFFVSSNIYQAVDSTHDVNDALRFIMRSKANMFDQPWYMISFNNNIFIDPIDTFDLNSSSPEKNVYDNIVHGILYNYK